MNFHHIRSASLCTAHNVGTTQVVARLTQQISAVGASVITGGLTYTFLFFANQVSLGPSYVQSFDLQWRNTSGGIIESTGPHPFTDGNNFY